jgi:hypothetical protein
MPVACGNHDGGPTREAATHLLRAAVRLDWTVQVVVIFITAVQFRADACPKPFMQWSAFGATKLAKRHRS